MKGGKVEGKGSEKTGEVNEMRMTGGGRELDNDDSNNSLDLPGGSLPEAPFSLTFILLLSFSLPPPPSSLLLLFHS